MDAATFLALAAICAPLVDPDTARAIVQTESGCDQYAIGVVSGSLQRQPRTVAEALSTAVDLRSHNRNFSVGLAQINVHTLERFRVSTADGFDACTNLGAMQRVLVECFQRASGKDGAQPALRRTLSCYYSGNFKTGFQQGYVNRVITNAQKTARAPP
jgi:type IV secretion system protein VirB1